MKRAVFKVHPDKGGWLKTTLCPISDKHEANFGVMDVMMFAALVLCTAAVARLLIAH